MGLHDPRDAPVVHCVPTPSQLAKRTNCRGRSTLVRVRTWQKSVIRALAGFGARGALRPGIRLDEFEIVRVLGVGGFGIVYLALVWRDEVTIPACGATYCAAGERSRRCCCLKEGVHVHAANANAKSIRPRPTSGNGPPLLLRSAVGFD